MNPTDILTIELTVAEWNQVLALLSDGPYKLVAPLLAKITAQATERAATALPSSGNGMVPEKALGV